MPRSLRAGLISILVASLLAIAGVVNAEEATDSSPPTHESGSGFRLVTNKDGIINFRLYTYVRYLNQKGLDDTYTDSFGTPKTVLTREDIQVNKMMMFLFGWFLDPKLRYLSYVWTTNTSQGLGAQVVVAGNLTYMFNERIHLGFGINALPGTRSCEGNYPFWMDVDQRLIADEFFRPSYTTGIWVRGNLRDDMKYDLMLGNNLSQLGIDAGQLDNGLNTFTAHWSWMPTTGEFGRGFGDYEEHRELATRVGAHLSRSDEDAQSQPSTEAPDNVQVRLSDGNIVFAPDLFGPGVSVTDVRYVMGAVDGGIKRNGYALDGEYYWRKVDHLSGPGVAGLGFDALNDHGFTLQASAMAIPKRLQIYAGAAKIFGEYGNPFQVRGGINWYLWATSNCARWNTEVMYLDHSPVGALSLPYTVGGNGAVFHTNFEINF